MDPDAFSSLKAFSTFRAHPTAVCWCYGDGGGRNTTIALVADVIRVAGLQRNASLQTPLARTGAHHEFADRTLRCSSHVLASVGSATDDAYRPQRSATGPCGTPCQNSGSCPKIMRAPAVSSACSRSRDAIIASRSKTWGGRRLSWSVWQK